MQAALIYFVPLQMDPIFTSQRYPNQVPCYDSFSYHSSFAILCCIL